MKKNIENDWKKKGSIENHTIDSTQYIQQNKKGGSKPFSENMICIYFIWRQYNKT